MKHDNIERNDDFGKLMQKSIVEVPDADFEDKIMNKVLLAGMKKSNTQKNIRLSWIFLLLSFILFPMAYFILKDIQWGHLVSVSNYLENISKTAPMMGAVIFSILFFLQLDNLLRLTFKKKLF